MSFQREEYKEYLRASGIYNASPYCSCLDKIERALNVNIDNEYDTDKCEGLLRILLEHRGNAADDAKKYGQYKNLISKLNKYCQFRNAPDQPFAVKAAAKAAVPVEPRRIVEETEESFFYNANGMTTPMEEYIRQCNSYDEFEARYLDQFIDKNDRVGKYLEKLLWKYDKNQATVSKDAGLTPAHVGNIVRGRINDPSRDVLIAICLAIGTTVDEVQHLLRYAGHNPLYVRRKRDIIIWFGFMKHDQMQEDRYVNEEFPRIFARDGAEYLELWGEELKMHVSCEIPEIGFKIHTRCFACRIDENGELQSLKDGDDELFIEYFPVK